MKTAATIAIITLLSLGLGAEAVAQDLFVTQATLLAKRYNGATGTDLGVFVSGAPGGERGIDVGPDLNLYIAKSGGVFRFNGLTGVFIDEFVPSGTFASTQGIDWATDGHLYVSTRSDGVYRFNAAGSNLGAFASGGGLDAQSSVLGPDGHLYVASILTNEVRRYNGASGSFIDNFVSAGSGGLFRPSGLVFGPDGNLYVSSQANDVKRYNGATGAFIDSFASGGLSNPQGIAFGPDGNLYVASTGTNVVKRYNGATGVDLGTFASGVTLPIYIHFYTPEQPVSTWDSSWGGVKAKFE